MGKRKRTAAAAYRYPDILNENDPGLFFSSDEPSSDSDGAVEDSDVLSAVSGDSTDMAEEEDERENRRDGAEHVACPPVQSWTSKSGIEWSPESTETRQYRPAGTSRPGITKYAISRIDNLQSAFDFFVTDEIINIIVNMTNVQGKREERGWKTVDSTEMRAFIGLLILAGLHRSRGEATHSLWGESTGRAIFRATMSVARFSQLSRNIRFEDRLTRPARKERRSDKLAPIRDVWDKWVARLPVAFNPGEDVCVDEQLLAFKGNCPFRQFMPGKPAKYGLKLWVLCDVSTCYAWKIQPYLGRAAADAPLEKPHGRRVVMDLTAGLSGNTVTTDAFFTSYALGVELLKERKMALVGTIRRNMHDLPPQLQVTRHRPKLSSCFGHTKDTTVVSYIPKHGRNVLLLSTKHREAALSKEEHKKPQMILDYDRCKGAVDTLDELVRIYSCKRMTRRWPVAVFCNMLDISAYNALVLWLEVDPSWNQGKRARRRTFLYELGTSLVTPQMACRPHLPKAPGAAAMVEEARQQGPSSDLAPIEDEEPEVSTTRRKCHLCHGGYNRRYARTCAKCKKSVCKEHTVYICMSCLTA